MPPGKYRPTFIAVGLAVAYGLLFSPIPARLPEPGEVEKTAGALKFERAGEGGEAVFSVDGVRIDCGISALTGGMARCGRFAAALDPARPVEASWFWMGTRYGTRARMLHEIAQDGTLKVTPRESLTERQHGYGYSRKKFLDYYFMLLAVLVLVLYQGRRKKADA